MESIIPIITLVNFIISIIIAVYKEKKSLDFSVFYHASGFGRDHLFFTAITFMHSKKWKL